METITSLQRTESNAEGGEGVKALPLGKVFGTFGSLVAFAGALDDDLNSFLSRHANGDWGDVDEHDRTRNELSLTQGLRLWSVYHAGSGVKFWLITEADRSYSTVLLPEDY